MIRINLVGETLSGAVPPSRGAAPQAEAPQVYGQADGGARASLPIAGILAFLLLSLFGGGYYLWLSQEVADAEALKVKLEKEKQELEKYTQLERTFREQKATLEKKREVLTELKNAQGRTVRCWEALANCVADDVWFKEITQKGNNITIKGESTSYEAINQFRTRLVDQSKWFDNIQYPGADKKGRNFEFTLSFNLKNPAA